MFLDATEALLPRARSRAHFFLRGRLHVPYTKYTVIYPRWRTLKLKKRHLRKRWKQPIILICLHLAFHQFQEKAKMDNEGLKRKCSMKEKKETTPELPYKVPSWSGVPEDLYSLEVLKNGCIISNIDLTSKLFRFMFLEDFLTVTLV